MTQHASQIESVLLRAVQDVFSRGLNDPRVRGLVSVTRVELAGDYSEATVWCSVLPEEHGALSIRGIESAGRWIRREAAEKVRLRRMPQLRFKLDASLKKQADVLSAINEGRRRDETDRLRRAGDAARPIADSTDEESTS
ncbi:MAG: 30S ribosome-binding factor RbfA [Phycisphaerales bacterium]|jgi:ribosome-binding factor A|nr:30S ribosome-binding factor RbfA [Phycisphaerales bacterium]